MQEPNGRNTRLQARVDPETLERVQRVADALYDGNAGMLVRVAVKRFVAEHEPTAEQEAERETEVVAA